MAVSLQLTDSAPTLAVGAYCSGLTAPTVAATRFAGAEGGTAGSTPVACTLTNGENNRRSLQYEFTVPSGYDGAAGDWTVRWNVSSIFGSCTLNSIYVCRVNAAGVNQETLGSVTGLSTSLGSAGEASQIVNQASSATFAADDFIVVVFGMSGPAGMVPAIGAFVPSSIVTAPGSTAAPSRARYITLLGID